MDVGTFDAGTAAMIMYLTVGDGSGGWITSDADQPTSCFISVFDLLIFSAYLHVLSAKRNARSSRVARRPFLCLFTGQGCFMGRPRVSRSRMRPEDTKKHQKRIGNRLKSITMATMAPTNLRMDRFRQVNK